MLEKSIAPFKLLFQEDFQSRAILLSNCKIRRIYRLIYNSAKDGEIRDYKQERTVDALTQFATAGYTSVEASAIPAKPTPMYPDDY